MRKASKSQHSTPTQAHGFQTKYIPRSGYARQSASGLSQSQLNIGPGFSQTASQLNQTNFAHHGDCVCEQCECGRHLCKFHVIKPDLTKNTIYKRSYQKSRAVPNIVKHDKEYDRLQGPHLDMNSTYAEGLGGRKGDPLERPKPEDLLKTGGPCGNLTSYSTQFPGHHGKNQYVKPTDRHHRAAFPLRSRTTYSRTFAGKQQAKDDYTYIPDQLRTGSNWFGRTTYSETFANPNPEYFAKKVKIVEKKEDNPDFSRQYGTYFLMQRQCTRTTSWRRRTRCVPPRSRWRRRPRDSSESPRATSRRTPTSRPSLPSSTPSPPPSTATYDLTVLTNYTPSHTLRTCKTYH